MNLKVVHNHSLSMDEVRTRVAKLGEFLTKNGIGVVWQSENVAKVSGKYIVVKIDALVTITSKQVVIDGKDPGFLWRRKAQEFLQSKMKEYI